MKHNFQDLSYMDADLRAALQEVEHLDCEIEFKKIYLRSRKGHRNPKCYRVFAPFRQRPIIRYKKQKWVFSEWRIRIIFRVTKSGTINEWTVVSGDQIVLVRTGDKPAPVLRELVFEFLVNQAKVA